MNYKYFFCLLFSIGCLFYPAVSRGQTDSIRSYQEIVGDLSNVKNPEFSANILEQQPQFPGGMAGWVNHLKQNIKYPEKALRKRISGKVLLQFVIEKDGSLSEIKVLQHVGGGCDEEAVRVLKLSPLWKPGMINGKPVCVSYTAPIVFGS